MNPGKKLAAAFFLLILLASCSPRLKKQERPAPPSPPIRVLLAEIASVDSLEFSGLYHLQTEEARYAFGARTPRVYLRVDSSGFRIYNKKRFLQFRTTHRVSFNPAQSASYIRYRGHKYAGRISLIYKKGKLLLIEQLPLEHYIAGVVPAEIFTNKKKWFEAVKAQAVCARTYAYKKIQSRKKAEFDVYGDVRDQAYGGLGRQTLLGDKATEQTRGSVLFYKDSLAYTYFHACDGGASESVADVWGQKERPYLTGRQDALGDSFSCAAAPVFRWRQTRSMAQLDSAYAFMFGHGFSDSTVSDTTRIALSLRVASRTPSGRVKQLELLYGGEKRILSGYAIRRFLAWPLGGYLPSTLFRLEKKGDKLRIIGGGNGHGVGMCQYGAMGRSEKGMRFYHILQSYYPGTHLEKVY
ncbi:MAG TPA: SpoIID/LytB domain-containing protein [Caldithrix abyssi]|uniref:SpoIID/LytB domain-containing protein n=1 Tax=Caldithrix abyssi TaxID=187145 RepID=A0A7V5VFK3_CALAY|nr:SpoIID/LytB domain-containing protein [Caldithrix abyssi]